MNTINNNTTAKTVAAPYYGSIIGRKGRLEQIYIKLTTDPSSEAQPRQEICIWNPKDTSNLPEWLSQQGIETLLCTDKDTGSELPFLEAGIQVIRDLYGDIEDMISTWSNQRLQNRPLPA
ncbi:MAG: hypothetical protein C0618_11375 [Desulfuromonas sp.]|nr:MAG: hypothetical protein C0618_11375 [Desulfuromonas sp.]